MGSVAGELGRGAFGAGVVDQGLAVGGGGDERGGGGVVELAWQPTGDPVQAGDGVVGEQRVGAAGQGEVVVQVGGGFGKVHRWDGVAGGDALVEGGKGAQAQPAGQGGLADQDAGKGAGGVHVGVGEQAELLELLGGQQVGLVEGQDDAAVALMLLGGE